jgi:hypothetical protein
MVEHIDRVVSVTKSADYVVIGSTPKAWRMWGNLAVRGLLRGATKKMFKIGAIPEIGEGEASDQDGFFPGFQTVEDLNAGFGDSTEAGKILNYGLVGSIVDGRRGYPELQASAVDPGDLVFL